jgi:hypothetical protein
MAGPSLVRRAAAGRRRAPEALQPVGGRGRAAAKEGDGK